MKQSLTIFFMMMLGIQVNATDHLPNAWINEIHYDNNSGDVGEAVEIVIEKEDEVNMELLKLELYNGSNGTVYKSFTLKDSVACSSEGVFSFYLLNIDGIQNGAPDGFCLSYDEHVLQFLSYEGVIDATDGTAAATSSLDIGVSEGGTTEIGQSLQLSGVGTTYDDFTWQEPATSTYCGLNNDQLFQLMTGIIKKRQNSKVWINSEGQMVISISKNQRVDVFDLTGRIAFSSRLEKGANIISIQQKGIFIVKTGELVEKVILR